MRGFTLTEIMIVLLIIAIIAALAYPSYLDQVRKSRRAVAKSALLDAASREEQNYFSCRTYSASMASSSPPECPNLLNYASDPAYFGKDSTNLDSNTDAVYAISVVTADNAAFKLQAVPQNDQANDSCGTFTLTSDNKKDAAVGNCW
jgi:type IV pilus assembly protein PilE